MVSPMDKLVDAVRTATISAPPYMIDNLARCRLSLERDVEAGVLARHIVAKLKVDVQREFNGILEGPFTRGRPGHRSSRALILAVPLKPRPRQPRLE
jgi:hypothetical protein